MSVLKFHHSPSIESRRKWEFPHLLFIIKRKTTDTLSLKLLRFCKWPSEQRPAEFPRRARHDGEADQTSETEDADVQRDHAHGFLERWQAGFHLLVEAAPLLYFRAMGRVETSGMIDYAAATRAEGLN